MTGPHQKSTRDPTSDGIAQWIIENRATLWPHLSDLKLPEPEGRAADEQTDERASSAYDNFGKSLPLPPPGTTLRPSFLSREVERIYNALSFCMWQHGVIPNAHLTISFGAMRVFNQRAATRMLSLFNKEARRWLRVGEPDTERYRMTRRAAMGSSPHHYIYVFEFARDFGFHVHELAYIPRHKVKAFEAMARAWFSTQCTHQITDDAIKIVWYRARNEADAVSRCWDWYRYLTKNLHPGVHFKDNDGNWQQGRRIFKLNYPYRDTEPVYCSQLAGVSETIGQKARVKAGFYSRFQTGEWDALYDGWELKAYRQRLQEEAQAKEMAQVLAAIQLP